MAAIDGCDCGLAVARALGLERAARGPHTKDARNAAQRAFYAIGR